MADTSAIRDKELQKAVVKARIDTTHDVLRKIRPQVNWVVTSLCNEFEQIRRAEREKTIADFNKIIRKQHLELDARIREIEREKIEELHIQRRELYVQNAMNIIFTFCMERLRSNSQLQTMHKHFECIKYRNCETNGSTKSYRVDHCYERTDVRSCRRDVFCSI